MVLQEGASVWLRDSLKPRSGLLDCSTNQSKNVYMELYSSFDFGPYQLRNRLVMAPMTRLRAGVEGVPGDLVAEYYAQRASMGLIVTEGVFPDLAARTWLGQPGIETPEQIAGWRKIADVVHDRGGTIVMQIMHAGRLSHPTINGTGRVVSASATTAPGYTHNTAGRVDYIQAEPLTEPEIEQIIASWVRASRHAIDAGMDGVQIHGANGYLIHQFLSTNTNLRTDAWGGSPEARARLAIEVTRAVVAEIGGERTSIRLSPQHNIQGIEETDVSDVDATYHHLARELEPLGLGFVDILHADPASGLVQGLRRAIGAPLVVNQGFVTMTTRDSAAAYISEGVADAVAAGRPALANPDLVERWRTGAPENAPIQETIYGGGASGYTDYPTLQG